MVYCNNEWFYIKQVVCIHFDHVFAFIERKKSSINNITSCLTDWLTDYVIDDYWFCFFFVYKYFDLVDFERGFPKINLLKLKNLFTYAKIVSGFFFRWLFLLFIQWLLSLVKSLCFFFILIYMICECLALISFGIPSNLSLFVW